MRLFLAFGLSMLVVLFARAVAAGEPLAVVIADPHAETTANARLRAELGRALADRGYTLATPPAVAAALAAENAYLAGEVTVESPVLERVRQRLGARLLVRVHRTGEGGILVVAHSESGARSASARPTDVAIVHALGSILPTDPVAPRVPETRPRSGVGHESTTSLETAEQRRQSWKRRGGVIVSYEARAQVLGFVVTNQRPCCTGGFGAGAGMRLGLVFLKPPNRVEDDSVLVAGRLGSGVDAGYLGVSPAGTNEIKGNAFSVQVPGYVGALLGVGGFSGEHGWNGIAVGFDYRPSYYYQSFTFENQTTSSDSFNYLGFELTVDFVSLEAAVERFAPEAHFRISAFVLPPVDDLPLFGSLGLGAVWY